MKQLSKKTKHQFSSTWKSAQGSSAAVLCLAAGKILRRRVVSRVSKIYARFGLTLAYRLKTLAYKTAIKLYVDAVRKFAAHESSFFWMFGENPYSF